MPALYEITQELSRLFDRAEEQGGELSDQDFILLDELEGNFDDKGERVIKVIRSLQADAKRDREEARFFEQRAGVAENRAKWLKLYLQRNLESLGLKKRQFGLFIASLGTASMPTVEVLDIEVVPEKYVFTTKVVAKKAATLAYKEGERIPGLAFKHSTFLRIK